MSEFWKEMIYLLIFTFIGGLFIAFMESFDFAINYIYFLVAYLWGTIVLQRTKIEKLEKVDNE